MATLEALQKALKLTPTSMDLESSPRQPLLDAQESDGADLLRSSESKTYQDFVIPELSRLFGCLPVSRNNVSVLEVGPGSESVLGCLPEFQRRRITRYTAFECNFMVATRLQEWLCSTSDRASPLPSLAIPPVIHTVPFGPQGEEEGDGSYDIVLFCHSMYGMKPKLKILERALELLDKQVEGAMVVVFHRDKYLHLDGLVCHHAALFPAGIAYVPDKDGVLDDLSPYIAGFVMQDMHEDAAVRRAWRAECRALARHDKESSMLCFSAPIVMLAFNKDATALPELTAQVPLVSADRMLKNWEARRRHPAAIVRPTQIGHIQHCVRWAMNHRLGLAVLGGSHSGHCVLPNVVSVDMSSFDQIHVLGTETDVSEGDTTPHLDSLVVVEAGCKVGDIIRMTMEKGLTVTLGARPSIGAGLWLQGGIGHLSRLYGLACDAIVGAVVVSANSGDVLYVGNVPREHRPVGAVRPENDSELLWAIKGAGTNFGIVVSVTFTSLPAPTFSIRTWTQPLSDDLDARLQLSSFDDVATNQLPLNCSADAYLYWKGNELHLGVTLLEISSSGIDLLTSVTTDFDAYLGLGTGDKIVNGIEIFDTEMYMSDMHGGDSTAKTNSFKRCLFLTGIGHLDVTNRLVAALKRRPTPLSYLHLEQGGGAICKIAADDTAFGCRDWQFACIVTGVWCREQCETEVEFSAVRWVYEVVEDLIPFSSGVYGADLGPDPRDAMLATRAFGRNRSRLACIKRAADPFNVLAYACPIPRVQSPQIIILVTGESGAGKDYCADVWSKIFSERQHIAYTARVVSISDITKQQYAINTKADLSRLLRDRTYKEQHRQELTAFFQQQVRKRPQLREENFLSVVERAGNVDILLVTGMRDEAPVTALSHLVPGRMLLDVRIQVSKDVRRARIGLPICSNNGWVETHDENARSTTASLDYCPTFTFINDTSGQGAVASFAERHLLPLVDSEIQQLADLVHQVPNFPDRGTAFRHILGISQRPHGLTLCTSLLQTRLVGGWAKVHAIACCEAGGFIYAAALAARIDLPLRLIRKAGKLPPPTFSVAKPRSYISSKASDSSEERLELEQDAGINSGQVVVVEDVLSTGATLCAILQLLIKVGIRVEDISVLVVAEFPVHRGRELLRQRGFGRTSLRSLLVFDGP